MNLDTRGRSGGIFLPISRDRRLETRKIHSCFPFGVYSRYERKWKFQRPRHEWTVKRVRDCGTTPTRHGVVASSPRCVLDNNRWTSVRSCAQRVIVLLYAATLVSSFFPSLFTSLVVDRCHRIFRRFVGRRLTGCHPMIRDCYIDALYNVSLQRRRFGSLTSPYFSIITFTYRKSHPTRVPIFL